MEYRIVWKSLLTGFKSNGHWFKSKDKEMLKHSVQEMNKKYKNEITHWLVKRDDLFLK
jgi:hypothetical protein